MPAVAMLLLLSVAPVLSQAAPALAAEPAGYVNEIGELAATSDAVVLGNIERQEIGVSETAATVRVVRSFKGTFKNGEPFKFKTGSGRVKVIQNQPDLTGVNRAVFYLIQDKGPAPNTAYRCVQDNYGFKPVINDHVYTNPQNPLETVQLKKYQEALTKIRPAAVMTPAGLVKPVETAEPAKTQ